MTNQASSSAAAEERQPFDSLFAHHPIPMWIFSRETLAFLEVNQAAIEAYGYSRAEFLAMTIKDIRPAEDVPRLLDFMKPDRPQWRRAGQWRHRLKDGTLIDVEITSNLMTYNGQPATLVMAQNITAQVQAEKRLRESETRYRQLVEMSPDAIAVHQDGRAVFCNPAGVRMMRAGSPQELIGKPIADIVHPDDWPAAQERIQRILAGETALYPVEVRYMRLDGTVIEVEVTAVPIAYENKPAVQIIARDISARKESERRLQQKDLFTRDILDSLTAHLVVLDTEGVIVTVNAAWDRFARDNGIGQGRNIFVGINYLDVVERAIISDAEPSAQAALTGIRAVISGAQAHFSLAYNCHSPSQQRWFVMQVTPLAKPGQGVIIVHENVTEQMQANRAVQISEEKYRHLVETSHDLIWAVDGVGRLTFINQAARRIYGRDPAEMIGYSYADFIPQDQVKSNEAWAEMIDSENRITNYEHWVWHKDGDPVRVNTNAVVQRDGDGTVIAAMGTSQDITQRNQIEEQLRYQAYLLDSVSDAIIAVDLNFNITLWNQAAERIYGWRADEVLGKRVGKVLPTQMINDTVEGSRNKLLNESQWQGEVIHTCKDGAERYILSTVTLLKDVDGNTIGAVAVNHDMTDRKALERENETLTMQYHQAQKMESLGRLAGGIAHDFNNLLVPILGYAELGLLAVPPEDQLYDNFERISRAAGRAADLTRQILAISRRQVLEMRLLQLNDIITGFQQMLRRIIGEDIAIETHLEADIWPIKADKGQIEQVLLNLAVNARDAMPQGGRLSIETANIILDETYAATHAETEPGPYTVLAVTDTGHGIDAEILPHIFEPFFTTKQPGQGTGLGLATVYGIIKQHRGQIWVYSEANRDTTFKIYLPAVDVPIVARGDSRGADSQLPRGTETVLVVEDEAVVRRLVCDTLASYGYRVLEASGPEQGLALADAFTGEIDLLLTDVIMPKLNGRVLYERLLMRRPGLRVVYMSGYTDNVIGHHGVVDEGITFLQKPFSIRHLLELIRQALEQP